MPQGSELLAETLRRALRDPVSVRQELVADLLEGREPAKLELPESRASGRLGVSLDATLLAREANGRRWPVRITDVGLSGLGAELADRPPEAVPVLVEMCLPILGECHLLPGRISWVQEARSGARAGVELADECAWPWFAALLRIVGGAKQGGFQPTAG